MCPEAISELKPHIRQHCHAYEPADHGGDGPRILAAALILSGDGVVADEAALGRTALRAQVVAGQLLEGRPVVAGRGAQGHWVLQHRASLTAIGNAKYSTPAR